MNLPQSSSTMKSPRSLFVAGVFVFGLLALSNSAQAVVTVTFAQNGSNVTATLSGSLNLPLIGERLFDDSVGNNASFGSTTYLYSTILASTYDTYGSGTSVATGLSQNPDSYSGLTAFGYWNGLLIVPGFNNPGDTINPTGTWTWNNNTLAGIGLGSLTITPLTVYQAAGASKDTIQFVLVPEPSSSVLLGLGVTALLFRRRRLA